MMPEILLTVLLPLSETIASPQPPTDIYAKNFKKRKENCGWRSQGWNFENLCYIYFPREINVNILDVFYIRA